MANLHEDNVDNSFQALLSTTRQYLNQENCEQLCRAFDFGKRVHAGQFRDSGVAYFTHPIAVASLLAEMHLDTETLITALLHDTIEDCNVTADDIETSFGKNISHLVDGVTKLSQINVKPTNIKQAENFRKFIVSVGKDIRVLLVKLADRTHNMLTIDGISDATRKKRIARETMEIYAPLAERMGITRFQTEMEQKCFEILHPEVCESIVTRLDIMTAENEKTVLKICKKLKILLTQTGISCDVSGRHKTPYSIARKMHTKNMTIDQLSDVMAFRIIVQDIPSCYRALGIVHMHFHVIMGRFKDYISTPKVNGYQSLHTGVMGPLKQRIEIQIRTIEMNNMAERGVAVHWHYKESQAKQKHTIQPPESFRWAKELMHLLDLNDEATELLENTKLEMYQDQVFCFTPKGELIGLPKGATAIDFAYAVHTDIGDKCVGAMINDKRRQLTTQLINGDQIKILTDRTAQPKSEWESCVVTGRAKSAIKRYIRLQRNKEFASVGKALLEKEYRFRKIYFKIKKIKDALSAFHVHTIEDLYVQIAESQIKARDVFERLHPEYADLQKEKTKKRQQHDKKTHEPVFLLDNAHEGLAVHLGKCCHPLPGDRIVGIVTTGKGITVHNKACSILSKFVDMPELWLAVDWQRESPSEYVGRITTVIINEPGALAALCTVISQHAGNISHIQLVKRNTDFFTFILDVNVRNREHIKSIIVVLRAHKYVESVERYRL